MVLCDYRDFFMLLQDLSRERAFQAEHKPCLGPGGKEEYSIFDSIVSMFHTCRRLRSETWRSREKMNEERPFMDSVLRLI